MFRMIRWLLMDSCHLIGNDIIVGHGVNDHSRWMIGSDAREGTRVQLPLGNVL